MATNRMPPMIFPAPSPRSWQNMRRGCRSMASIAEAGPVIGTRSSGFSPMGVEAGFAEGIGGGTEGGVFSFIKRSGIQQFTSWKKVPRMLKGGFKEISIKRVGAEEFHRQMRRADERAQNPSQLAAQQ